MSALKKLRGGTKPEIRPFPFDLWLGSLFTSHKGNFQSLHRGQSRADNWTLTWANKTVQMHTVFTIFFFVVKQSDFFQYQNKQL